MAVFRVQKTQNYTIMSNHHLRNKALSLKAKGLLSLMLSLPEDWDYTTRGLASICKEGVDSVCATVRELEAAGYIIRRRIRDKNGQMRGMEYTVLEQPQPPEQGPEEAAPKCAQPKQAEPKREKPVQENPAQLNTKEIKKEETNNVSNPIRTADEREQYRDLIRENIEYDILAKNNPADRIRLDELVELMLDTVCSKRSSIRIAGDEFPTEVVKSRFLKLEAQHIQYVLDSLKDNPPHIPQLSGRHDLHPAYPDAVPPSRPHTQGTIACACALPYGRVREHFFAERYIPVGAGHYAFPRYFLLHHRSEHGAAQSHVQGRLGITGRSVRRVSLPRRHRERNPQVCFGTAGERNDFHHQLQPEQGTQRQLQHQPPAIRARCAILVREEFSCLEFIMNRDTINWILK